jgi:hypothetical protein
MFSRFKRWMQEGREWDHGQRVVWPRHVVVGADGLTPFQHEAVRQLVAAIGHVDLQRANFRKETYLTGTLPGTDAVISIYPDGAQIHQAQKAFFMAESEDHATPQDLIRKLVTSAQHAQSAWARPRAAWTSHRWKTSTNGRPRIG